MPPAGFEPTISVGERPQTYALERAAAGTGTLLILLQLKSMQQFNSRINQLSPKERRINSIII